MGLVPFFAALITSLYIVGCIADKDSNSGDGKNAGLDANSTLNSTGNRTLYNLTGNPQVDYKYDPNLPHELNGYDLSSYPFFSRVPKDINFPCTDDLKDGFYANKEYHCQVTFFTSNGILT